MCVLARIKTATQCVIINVSSSRETGHRQSFDFANKIEASPVFSFPEHEIEFIKINYYYDFINY